MRTILDSFNQFPGYNANYIPACTATSSKRLDLMYDHLRHGRSLPPSQVVHTIPRGTGTPLRRRSHFANVACDSQTLRRRVTKITFTAGQVKIPN